MSSNQPGGRLSQQHLTRAIARDPAVTPAIPAEVPGLFLVALEGPGDGRWVPLSRTPIAVGRDPGLDLVLDDAQVSRVHLMVAVVDGEVVVEDLGSTNGTFIDGVRVVQRAPLPVGSLLCVGSLVFRCQRATEADRQRAQTLRRDLERAADYVVSLLPPPARQGPVHTEWLFLPSSRLGGDAFGYDWLDDRTFVLFLLDVAGHGVCAAMHSVAVLNVLRQRALVQADFTDPVQVLSGLNAMFQMDRHDDQYFTLWYGVYDLPRRTLTYASAGHHPAYLRRDDRTRAVSLTTNGIIIGAMPKPRFHRGSADVPAGSRLYLFSDGAFEAPSGRPAWSIDDVVRVIEEPAPAGRSECDRLHDAVRCACGTAPLGDDFSALVVTFP